MADEALIGTEVAGREVPRSTGSALRQRFVSWSRRRDLPRWLAICLACAAVTSGAITYATMSGLGAVSTRSADHPDPAQRRPRATALARSAGRFATGKALDRAPPRGGRCTSSHADGGTLQSCRLDADHCRCRVLGAFPPFRDAILVQREGLERNQSIADRRAHLRAGTRQQHSNQHAGGGHGA